MENHFKFIGALLLLLAGIHVVFPKYFKWKEELEKLSLVNKEIMIIHTFFIAVIVSLNGILCLTSYSELVNTEFGKKISLGIGVFWGIRLVVQFFGYSADLWKGKTFETIVHIIFSLIWTYLTIVFLWNWWV